MPAPLAAQLYTLRQFTKTPAEVAATLKKVKQIGYDAVQCSALGPIETGELAAMLRGEGLVCCATHEPFDRLRDQTRAVIDKHQALGCRYTAVGSLPETYRTREGYRAFAREAGEVARNLAAGGLVFGYHNHDFELERFDGRTALNILFDESDPRYFTAEIDTYWIQHGGGDPAAWIRKLAGRVPLVHLKDMAFAEDRAGADALGREVGESEPVYFYRRAAARAKKPIMAEVGEGNMNWPEILRACREAGVVWHIVEQDVCQRDPFESLAISRRNLLELMKAE